MLALWLLLVQPDPAKVDEAIDRGVAWLRKAEPMFKPWNHMHAKCDMRVDELVLWTFVRAGVKPDDGTLQKILKRSLDAPLERTYMVSLQAMALAELDRVKHLKRIARCAQFLADNQCQNGQWGYGEPVEMPAEPDRRIKKRAPGPAQGCNSNSQYAALGIRACAEAGIVFEPAFLKRAEAAWEQGQKQDGGWCYGMRELEHPKHESYGAMTAGGVGSLAIYKHLLGEKTDRHVEKGLKWLADNFSVERHPGKHEHGTGEATHYYYLYALERACGLSGVEKLGAHAWYAAGAKMLLDAQGEHGQWGTGSTVIVDTCFAILFLRRATKPLEKVATGDRKR